MIGAFRISAFLVALEFSSGEHAFDQEVEGYIKIFYSVMSERADFSDKTFVGLDSLTSAGSCLIDKGYVRLIITKNSKQLFATMYGAAMAGKKVRVRVNDSMVDPDNGSCLIWYGTPVL